MWAECSSHENAKKYFVEKKVLSERSKCEKEMCQCTLVRCVFEEGSPSKNKPDRYYRCEDCGVYYSEFKESILDRDVIKTDLNKFLLVCILIMATCIDTLITSITGLHHRTIAKYRWLITQAIIWDLQSQGEENMIGGDGEEIEVDECNFGKSKYGKGRDVVGVSKL
jgi:hypothetical protein